MRINFTYSNRIQTLVAVLLFMFCLTELPARGQSGAGRGFGGGKVIMQDYHMSFGMGPDESGRITVVAREDSEPIHANLKIFDVEGNQLIEKDMVIPPRAFRYMDVDPDEIVLRGEPDGRLQIAVRVELRKANGGVWEITNSLGSNIPVVLGEVINNKGSDSIWIDIGAPVMTTVDGRKFVPDGSTNTIAFGEALIGFGLAPQDKARISTFNWEPLQAIKITLRVWDSEGNQLAQREMVIAPGRLGYTDFAREDFDRIGESSGRLQLALTVTVSTPVDPKPGSTPDGTSNTIAFGEWRSSLEIVQAGRTVAGGHVMVFSGRVAIE